MVNQLSIKNIALIDELTIHFDSGLIILTGETGAGKSIIIDAVNLVLGERADRELIQTGKDFARVEILFSVSNKKRISELLSGFGISPEEDGTLLLMRELTVQGKNICRINGRAVTLSMLREISRLLVDIHGQHQHQSLLMPEYHIELLDRLGGEKLGRLKSELHDHYDKWQKVQQEIRKISGLGVNGERRKDLLLYQIDEISNANLSIDEDEILKKERALLLNAERIITTVNDSYNELYTGTDKTTSIADGLNQIMSRLLQIQNMDEGLDNISAMVENIQYQLEDVIIQLRGYKDSLEFDPSRLNIIEDRLDVIQNIKRKYGNSIEEVLKLKKELDDELYILENSQERLSDLNKQSLEIFQEVVKLCTQLSELRSVCALHLEKEMLQHLTDLNMEKTKFKVSIEFPKLSDINLDTKSISANGFDQLEFLISTNPGEPLKPLVKIISGGEMSRVMLAFKTILGNIDEIATLIFDEIDVGISGRTASAVAEKMCALSKDHQIICVTHLPQIAAMADTHFTIQKIINGNRTKTTVKKLDQDGRQLEVAKMIGGASITELSLEHAKELISKN